jgi:site-specific recombinase XerD
LPGLTGTDIDINQNRVRIHAIKGGKSRFYTLQSHEKPMFDVRKHAIERAKAVGSGRLFSGLTRSYLDKCIKKYGTAAGIHPELCHMHAIRHGVAMIIYSETQRPGAITNFLGHSDDKSCLPYLRENDGKFGDAAVAKFWSRLAV